jgi:hypothetical protein
VTREVVGSLIAAAVIVTARLGTANAAELELREDRPERREGRDEGGAG